MGQLIPLKPMPVLSEEPSFKSEFAPHTLDVLRDMVYGDSPIHNLEPVEFVDEITPAIDNMLESIHKLSKLAKALEKFESPISTSHIHPYMDEDQHIRCYLNSSYIVIEVNHHPKKGNWQHIIEKHGADCGKDSLRYYEFKIIKGLTDDVFLEKLQQGLDSIVETVEVLLYDDMHKTQTAYENIKHFRISDKKPNMVKLSKNVEIDLNDFESLKNKLFKTDRKPFWDGWFGKSDGKISFD